MKKAGFCSRNKYLLKRIERKHCAVRRTLCVLMMLFLCILVCPGSIHATEETKKKLQDAQDKRSETQSQLDEKKSSINSLNDQKTSLQSELTNLNDELTSVSEKLSEIEDQIDSKQEEIDKANEELEAAKKTEEEQYASMKKRIQYMYEKQNNVVLELLIESGSFSDLLNRTDYIEELSAYDRRKLEEYQATKKEIEDKEALLQSEMSDLSSYQAQSEAEQSRVSGLVSKTSGNISGYSSQISAAEQDAQAIESDIDQQDENIKALQAQLQKEIEMSKLAAQSSWRDISQVSFADGDRYLLANLIYCEAGGEPYQGKVAVGSVVINRVLSSVYPDTVVGVIYQNKQFSPVASGRLAIALADSKATDACYQAADEAMSGTTNVGECVYFRTPIDGLTGISIGGHIFY